MRWRSNPAMTKPLRCESQLQIIVKAFLIKFIYIGVAVAGVYEDGYGTVFSEEENNIAFEEIISREKRSPFYGCKELLEAAFRLGCENRVITGCSGGANSGGAEAEGSGTCTNSMSGENCTFQAMADGSDAIFYDSVFCLSCNATTGSSGFTQCTPEGCIGGCPEPPSPTTPATPAPHFPRTKCDPDGNWNWTEIYHYDCRDAIQTDCNFDYTILSQVWGSCINPVSGSNCSFEVMMPGGARFFCQLSRWLRGTIHLQRLGWMGKLHQA